MRIVSFYIIGIFFIGLVIFTGSVKAQSFYGTTDVNEFRKGRKKELNKKGSPLLDADLKKFTGLNYYKTSEKFRFKAKFKKSSDEKYFLMPTSSGRSVKYIKVGVLSFTINGKDFSLNAYQSEKITTNKVWNKKYGHAFFIPYKDLTNGKQTYGGGRYIYMKIPESKNTILDFNLTFNPSCAYGRDKYSCPIPPRVNHLKARIEAGEKLFHYSKHKK